MPPLISVRLKWQGISRTSVVVVEEEEVVIDVVVVDVSTIVVDIEVGSFVVAGVVLVVVVIGDGDVVDVGLGLQSMHLSVTLPSST